MPTLTQPPSWMNDGGPVPRPAHPRHRMIAVSPHLYAATGSRVWLTRAEAGQADLRDACLACGHPLPDGVGTLSAPGHCMSCHADRPKARAIVLGCGRRVLMAVLIGGIVARSLVLLGRGVYLATELPRR